MPGHVAYQSGLAAEASVERHYNNDGLTSCARRWRGSRGEVDLIFADGDGYVFVEVKKNKTHAAAAASLTAAQQQRIMNTALEFIADQVGHLDVDMRFDVATLSQTGDINIHQGAIGMH